MLTKCRIEKILELVKKEYDYMDNKPIYINTNYKGTWGAETTRFDYTLKVSKNFNDDDFIPFYYEYLADKFAVEMFNKYAVKILAILNGTSQKEIKSRLEEVKKRVA